MIVSTFILSSCSKDEEEIKVPENILGVWSPDETTYLEFCEDYTVRHLDIEYQDGQSIGEWSSDVYYYEPGYDLVIYIDSHQQGVVYKIVKLTDTTLVWSPVDEVDVIDREDSIGHIIGNIINKAQEGYKVNPELNQSFIKIPEVQFLEMLEKLNITYPWF